MSLPPPNHHRPGSPAYSSVSKYLLTRARAIRHLHQQASCLHGTNKIHCVLQLANASAHLAKAMLSTSLS